MATQTWPKTALPGSLTAAEKTSTHTALQRGLVERDISFVLLLFPVDALFLGLLRLAPEGIPNSMFAFGHTALAEACSRRLEALEECRFLPHASASPLPEARSTLAGECLCVVRRRVALDPDDRDNRAANGPCDRCGYLALRSYRSPAVAAFPPTDPATLEARPKQASAMARPEPRPPSG